MLLLYMIYYIDNIKFSEVEVFEALTCVNFRLSRMIFFVLHVI